MFFQQPSANSIRNLVTAPFQTHLWITIIGTWAVLITTVKIGSWAKQRRGSFHFIKNCGHVEGSFNVVQPHGQENGKPVPDEEAEKDVEFAESVGLWAIAANCQKCQ